ncbi:MAG: hypothetical protein IKU16_05440 [Muribaculaceae bacterium]|nr:hypothetical protein [Muribaculaceae bacterium]
MGSYLETNLDSLWRNVKTYRSSENFLSVMKACSRFRHLAPYNAILVEMQRPGARYVLSEKEWRNKYDRGIKPNARPLIVLVPFGPVDFLFEINDTYPLKTVLFGKTDDEILEAIANPYKTKRDVSDNILNTTIDRLAIHGIAIDKSFVAGANYAARIELLDNISHTINLHISKEKIINWRANYLLSINKNAQKGECFASICHELGHLFCQHLIAPEDWKKWQVRDLLHATKEFEAESVSWLVCERLGIGNPSEKYLSGYLTENNEIPPEVSIEKILYAVKEVWNICTLESHVTYRDGLLYKHCEDFKEMIKCIK